VQFKYKYEILEFVSRSSTHISSDSQNWPMRAITFQFKLLKTFLLGRAWVGSASE